MCFEAFLRSTNCLSVQSSVASSEFSLICCDVLFLAKNWLSRFIPKCLHWHILSKCSLERSVSRGPKDQELKYHRSPENTAVLFITSISAVILFKRNSCYSYRTWQFRSKGTHEVPITHRGSLCCLLLNVWRACNYFAFLSVLMD